MAAPMTAQVRVSGRLEILGNHTDYNGGHVLVAPAPGAIEIRSALGGSGLEIVSEAFGQARSLWDQEEGPGWERLARSATRAVREAWYWRPVGLRLEIGGDLPAGSGLASSAAVAVGIVRVCGMLAGLAPDAAEVATLAHRAETVLAGSPCGWLDHWSVAHLAGADWMWLSFRDQPPRHELLPAPPGLSCLVQPTSSTHAIAAGPYAERRAQCEEAARILGKRWLSDVSPAELEAGAAALGPLLLRRARHIVGEQERVAEALGALQSGRPERLGELLDASHASSRVNFENSSPAQDAAVAALRAQPGVLGARLTGGGFGGAVVALCRP